MVDGKQYRDSHLPLRFSSDPGKKDKTLKIREPVVRQVRTVSRGYLRPTEDRKEYTPKWESEVRTGPVRPHPSNLVNTSYDSTPRR